MLILVITFMPLRMSTLEENVGSEGNEDVNPMTISQGVQNVRISSRQYVFPKFIMILLSSLKLNIGLKILLVMLS